ncbi:MAG: calcium/sodium antiporter [Gemmatimonadales bacterium]
MIAAAEVVGGLLLLFLGGHSLVRGAATVALLARISTAVVALTVVSIGTSLPELAVSVDAALRRSTDISYGNIIGSNIFNIGAILGIAALVSLIRVRRQMVRIEYPIMFAVSGLVLLLARDGVVDRLEGGFLVVLLVGFLALMVYLARTDAATAQSAEREVLRAAHVRDGTGRAWGRNVAFVVLGIAALIGGADLTVSGAVRIAEMIGVEQRVIGLTVVAMGTSLPELATSLVAARRGEQEIALGNVVGSNIFNLLAILGITATIVPIGVHPRALAVDNWVMIGLSAALLPLMLWGRRVSRRDGVLLLTGFVAYMTWVVVTG